MKHLVVINDTDANAVGGRELTVGREPLVEEAVENLADSGG
jgi:hypothetical protein